MAFYLANEFGKILIIALGVFFYWRMKKNGFVGEKTLTAPIKAALQKEELNKEPELASTPLPTSNQDFSVDQSMKLRPSKGSWYLYSLHDAPYSELCKTFEGISLQEAMVVLKNFEKKSRDDILQRLQLVPAFHKKLSSEPDFTLNK